MISKFFTMKPKNILITVLSIYLLACTALIAKSGLFVKTETARGIMTLVAEDSGVTTDVAAETKISEMKTSAATDSPTADYEILSASPKTITLGSAVPETSNNSFLMELELTSKGASIATARLRDYDNRNAKDPKPLEVIKPLGDTLFTMSNRRLLFIDSKLALPMDKVNWVAGNVENLPDGSQTATFEAIVTNAGKNAVKLTKTYTLPINSYMLSCDLKVANLSGFDMNIANEIMAATGFEREGARMDMRTITGAFIDPDGKISTVKEKIAKLKKEGNSPMPILHKEADKQFIWASVANKYFAAIVRPVPAENTVSPNWISQKLGYYYPPNPATNQSEANIGIAMKTAPIKLIGGDEIDYKFEIYLGPKDRDLLVDNEHYNKLGFVNVVDFQACCGNLFRPLAFFILSAMKWMYIIIWPHNYGIVIIILVFIIRLLMHPITKKSQVSMMKMSKLGPMAEEIKKKYANNKAEQQKHMMQLYKQHGASPIMGFLPMMIQMPVWIALYSAIYASIELRGAAFLPFWITDLSSSDALFTLPAAIESVPFIGSFIGTTFNLLPILLAFAMFAQQKLMPSSAASSANPQAAQQQKMMLIMMPVMMLLFLYRAPSGLNLYIMASTTAGVIEQYVIRKHLREKEETEKSGLVAVTSKTGGKLKKKKPKPPFKFS